MAKIFGANTKISGKVGQLLYRQTRTGTVISELPVKPAIPRRSARQMDRRTQWGNLAAIYKQFDSMLRRGYENLPPRCPSSTPSSRPTSTWSRSISPRPSVSAMAANSAEINQMW